MVEEESRKRFHLTLFSAFWSLLFRDSKLLRILARDKRRSSSFPGDSKVAENRLLHSHVAQLLDWSRCSKATPEKLVVSTACFQQLLTYFPPLLSLLKHYATNQRKDYVVVTLQQQLRFGWHALLGLSAAPRKKERNSSYNKTFSRGFSVAISFSFVTAKPQQRNSVSDKCNAS